MNKELSEMTLEELWELFPIILKEYNPDYKHWYKIEETDLKYHLGDNIHRISHIGSTAVEGLIAKPIVDILLEADNSCNIIWLKKTIMELGWILMSSKEEPDMNMSFNKGYTSKGFAEKVYLLHVRYYGDWDELYFRDYLREYKDSRKEYEKLKLNIWKTYEHNRDGYTQAKSELVKKYSALARESYQGRYLPT